MIKKLTIHSGANNTKPNSYNFLNSAINYKHTYIEVDSRVSNDGICFLSHDKLIKNIQLDLINFSDVKKLDNDFITLDQAIIFAKNNKTKLNIDIKDEKYIYDIILCITNHNFESDCVISGVHIDGAKLIKELNDKINIIINFEKEHYLNIDYIIHSYNEINPYGININYLLLNNNLFYKLKNTNFEIYAWTVDSFDAYKICKNNSIYNITTNFPSLFKFQQ